MSLCRLACYSEIADVASSRYVGLSDGWYYFRLQSAGETHTFLASLFLVSSHPSRPVSNFGADSSAHLPLSR